MSVQASMILHSLTQPASLCVGSKAIKALSSMDGGCRGDLGTRRSPRFFLMFYSVEQAHFALQ